MEEVQCYNKGCTQKFKPSENTASSCRFHPGDPVFHDAYKSWSCCGKKTTDFTEFLNIKGCKVDFHSDVKPVVSESEKEKTEIKSVTNQINNKPIYVPMERPPEDMPLVPLKFTIGKSLQQQLDQLSVNGENTVDAVSNVDDGAIPIGTSCKNAACQTTYNGPKSNEEICLYHDGVPIFHEGMKYWSCCQRRTTDFDAFLEQKGCQSGKHLWIKPKSSENSQEDKSKTCRYDWHQTSGNVVVTIYSKVPIPSLSTIRANPVKLHAFVTFGATEKKEFEINVPLFGIIDVENSIVNYLSTKVEISFKKAEPVAWKQLTLKTNV
ncbi:cysteine and histidine-rich domain (chord)-containing: zinc binding protein-like protein [Dinothrombium tinctorium]|uniref:Cysteine and histidine-rich domain (Chord)-containing: zinc binding protein-like protein n=1 Tax=Dinothrombium tinctorium TaxID=1965070 RepID=A0A3S3S9B0_9ACAR|nr:cysteine and histidine-rich domain (chord)-containing: zinc binding protein-like protein [Dinothrombium tinctorium]RWS12249.1 cysteine and histidine-rich domain (chord)-containing: zinc binding protein-like protein [Dinothrombium tinctorium]RWS15265.1 cysteine and histidine-rich domain (chord)-containing: zinc binding protein-like protein [Dinothrombium tinctorium]